MSINRRGRLIAAPALAVLGLGASVAAVAAGEGRGGTAAGRPVAVGGGPCVATGPARWARAG